MTESEIHKIIMDELRDIKKDVRDLRKDLNGFKLRVVGFFTVLITGAEILKLYLIGGK